MKRTLTTKEWNKQKLAERKLAKSLQVLTRQVERITHKYDSIDQITAAISDITRSSIWKKYANLVASRMTESITIRNTRTWKEAAMASQNGLKIYKSLKAAISNNASFIKLMHNNAEYISGLPDDIAKHITKHVSSVALQGERAETLIPYLRRKAPELSEARINLIARTETAKTQAGVTEIRSTQLGIDWYIWRTAGDQRVRSSHKHMEGVLCQYSSPPSPEILKGEPSVGCYGPGGIWNCRCYAEPLIDSDSLPHRLKVVQGGQIVRMTRKQLDGLI